MRFCRAFELLEQRAMLACDAVLDIPGVPHDDACLLNANAPVAATFELAGDSDVFAFDAAVNEAVTLDITTAIPSNGLRLEVLAATANTLHTEFGTHAHWKAAHADRYFLRISSAHQTGDYQVAISTRIDEPDGPGTDLPVLEVGKLVAARIDAPADLDVFAIEPDTGGPVLIRAIPGPSSVRPNLRLLGGNSDGYIHHNTGVSELPTIDPRGHAYTVQVHSPVVGDYFLLAEPVEDDYTAETTETTPLLQLDTPLAAEFEHYNDVDAFQFIAVAGREYVISTDRASTTVRSPSGQVTATRSFVADVDGVYTITLSAERNRRHHYEVTVSHPKRDEYPNTIADAKAGISPGTVIRGVLQRRDDIDVVHITGEIGQTVRLHGANAWDVRLLDASGAEISDLRSQLGFTWHIEDEAGYYVAIRGESMSHYEIDYSVAVDDHADVPTVNATLISPEQLFSGVIEIGGDVDLFAIDLTEGQKIHISTPTNSDGWDAHLLDGLGRRLASRRAPSAGRYYISISNEQPDSFQAAVMLEGWDDHDDTPSDIAELFSIGDTLQPEANTDSLPYFRPKDVDVFAFDAVEGDYIRIYADVPPQGKVTLKYSSANDPSLRGASSGSDATWMAWATGRYFLHVTASGFSGAYDVYTAKIGEDDHGDTTSSASPLRSNTPVVGRFDRGIEYADVFSLGAASSRFAKITVDSDEPGAIRWKVITADRIVVPPAGFGDGSVWQIDAAQPLFIEVAGNSDKTVDYAIQFIDLDDTGDEPNAVSAVSTLRTPGAVVHGQKNHPHDIDVFGFTGAPGQLYEVGPGAFEHPRRLIALDEHGQKLPMLRPWLEGTGSFVAPSNGTFYVQASGMVLGANTFTVNAVPLAGALLPGDSDLPLPPDRAIYQITAKAGQYMQLGFERDPSIADLIIEMDSPQLRLAESHQGYYIREDASVYVMLVNPRPDQPAQDNNVVRLSLSLTDDDHPSSVATAQPLPLEQPVYGQLRDPLERDYFRIDVEEGVAVRVVVKALNRVSAPAFMLVRENGVSVATSSGGQLNWRAAFSGTVYLHVRGRPTEYKATLSLTKDDYADRIEDASLLPKDGNIHGEATTRSDQDVILVDATEGQVVAITAVDYPRWPGGVTVRGTKYTRTPLAADGETQYFLARQAGRYAIMLAPRKLGSYHLKVSTTYDDGPNDYRNAVVVTPSSEWAQGQLDAPGDVDYFAIDKKAGEKLQIQIESSSGARLLGVKGPDQQLRTRNSLVHILAPHEHGTFYFYAEDSKNGRTEYQYRVSRIEDDYPDATDGQLTQLVPGQPQHGVIEAVGDVDSFLLNAEPNTIYRFSGGYLSVFSPAGDNFRARQYGDHLNVRTTLGGEYVVSVRAGTPGGYTIQTVALADDVTDDNPHTARSLRLGQVATGTFEVETDVDVWKVDLVKGDLVQLTASLGGVELKTWDLQQRETVLPSRGDGWFEATRSATHSFYVEARGRTGDYTISVTTPSNDADIDRIASTIVPSTPVVEVGTSLVGKFDHYGDIDLYAIDVAAAERLDIRVPRSDAAVELVDKHGNVLSTVQPWERSGILYWTSYVSQRVYLRVAPRSQQYTIKIGRDQREVVAVGGRETLTIDFPQTNPGVLLEFDIDSPGRYDLNLRSIHSSFDTLSYKLYSSDMVFLQDLSRNRFWRPEHPGKYYVGITLADGPHTGRMIARFEPRSDWPQPSEWSRTLEFGQPVEGRDSNSGHYVRYSFDAQQGDVLKASGEENSWLTLPSVIDRLPSEIVDGDRYWQVPRDGRYYFSHSGDEAVAIERVGTDTWSFPIPDNAAVDRIDFQSMQPITSPKAAVSLYRFSATVGERIRFTSEAGSQLSVLDQRGIALATGQHLVGWVADEEGEYYLEVRRDVFGEDRIGANSSLRSPTDIDGDNLFTTADLDTLLANVHSQSPDPDSDINSDGRVDRADADTYFSEFGILAGDANLDRKVDFADFLALSTNFGRRAGSTWQTGDFNGDGQTSFADFLLLSTSFGESTTPRR